MSTRPNGRDSTPEDSITERSSAMNRHVYNTFLSMASEMQASPGAGHGHASRIRNIAFSEGNDIVNGEECEQDDDDDVSGDVDVDVRRRAMAMRMGVADIDVDVDLNMNLDEIRALDGDLDDHQPQHSERVDVDVDVKDEYEGENENENEDEADVSDCEADNEPMEHDEMLYVTGLQDMESHGLIDISNLAACEVSSAKQGCELSKLKDDSPQTYWQSDGQQPHYLVIRFTKCVNIERISLFLNYAVDESYTPDKISILAGSGEHDLIDVTTREFFEPIGWQHIDFKDASSSGFLKCYLVKIKFISNHQNGKDCHVRAVKIMSPISMNTANAVDDVNSDCVGFTSIKLISELMIR
jgi:anaphase-promoting complex subunit 10